MMVWIILVLISATLLFFFYASYSIRSGVYLKTLSSKPKAGKVLALTFDDGPHPIQTPKVLDVLKEHNIKACFFCIGSKIAGNEHIVKRIIDEGHLIGNHTYSHANNFPLQSLTQIKNDLLKCNSEIEKITLAETTLFRPPFGLTNPNIAKAVKALHLTTIGWNIRSFDTCTKSNEKIVKRIERKLSHGSVVLLHDRLIFSDTLLTSVIHVVKQKGYSIVRVDKLFNLN